MTYAWIHSFFFFFFWYIQTRFQWLTKLTKILRFEEKCSTIKHTTQNGAFEKYDKEYIHTVVEPNLFVAICRFLRDRMGQVKL